MVGDIIDVSPSGIHIILGDLPHGPSVQVPLHLLILGVQVALSFQPPLQSCSHLDNLSSLVRAQTGPSL